MQGRRVLKEIKTTSQTMDQVTSLNTTREMVNTMATNLCMRDNTNLSKLQAPIQKPRIDFGMIL